MHELRNADRSDPLRLLALAIASRGRLALLVAGRSRWHSNAGYTFVPLELPGVVQEPGTAPSVAADGLAHQVFGCAARLIASRQLYGPSDAHRIDRLPPPADDDDVLPLLRLERTAPLHMAATPTLRRVVVTVYRVRLAILPAVVTVNGDERNGDGAVSLLWLSPDALRLAMRGMAFAELLSHPAVEWVPAKGDGASMGMNSLPDDALVYVPSDYGERHLLRLVAKYGPEALFQGDDMDWDGDFIDSAATSATSENA